MSAVAGWEKLKDSLGTSRMAMTKCLPREKIMSFLLPRKTEG